MVLGFGGLGGTSHFPMLQVIEQYMLNELPKS